MVSFRKKKEEKFIKVLEHKKRPLRERLEEAYEKFQKHQPELEKMGGQLLKTAAEIQLGKTPSVPYEYLPQSEWHCDNCGRTVKIPTVLPAATCRVCGRPMKRVK